jgi:hypothetical protein
VTDASEFGVADAHAGILQRGEQSTRLIDIEHLVAIAVSIDRSDAVQKTGVASGIWSGGVKTRIVVYAIGLTGDTRSVIRMRDIRDTAGPLGQPL